MNAFHNCFSGNGQARIYGENSGGGRCLSRHGALGAERPGHSYYPGLTGALRGADELAPIEVFGIGVTGVSP